MEMIYFTIVAIILYIVSDRILEAIERKRGERLQNRSMYFFIIILVLAIISFTLIQSLYEKPGNESPRTEQTDKAPGTKAPTE